jgi:hypothetical protein
MAVLPATTHAAGYKHYVSTPLHFAIDYPSTWVTHYSKSGGYVSFNQSNSAALTVNYHARGSFTIKSFTNALVASYHHLGVSTGSPKFSGNKGQFTGSGTLAGYKVQVLALTLVDSHGAFSLAMAAPKAQFTLLLPTFSHMANSFSTR